MTKIGTLAGKGFLIVRGDDLGEVDCEIDVFLEGSLKHGYGHLIGDCNCLEKAFTGRDVMLRLRSGEEVKIVIKQLNNERAEVLVSSEIPGY